MELREILKFMDKNRKLFLTAVIAGLAVGACFYFLIPEKFTSTGSFYITRRVQSPSQEYFTYEGYYSQQTAVAYTNTVVALLESLDIREMTLERLEIAPSEKSLRKMGRITEVTKSGPQLVSLTVKRNSLVESEKTWEAYAESLINIVNETNISGDTDLKVVKVSENPVTKPTYKSLVLDIFIGITLMILATLGYTSLKEYLTNGGRKKVWK